MTAQQEFFSQIPRNVDPLCNGLMAYYKFDETSGNLIDYAHGNTGTLNGGVTQNVSPGVLNTCYTFNGSTGYVNCGRIMSSNIFTFAGWVKTSTFASAQTIISGTNISNATAQFRVNTSGNIELLLRGTASLGTSSGALSLNTFAHVAVTYDSAGLMRFYINGSASGTATDFRRFAFDAFDIGQSGASTEFWNGQQDELGIWSRVLSAGDITRLYNGGTGYNGFLAYL